MGFLTAFESAVCTATALSAFWNHTAGTTCHVGSDTFPAAVTLQGPVAGTLDTHGNHLFLGVPFAATTGGQNRWKAPQSPATHTSFFNASSFGPTCPQAITSTTYTSQSEDCLSANIWAPNNGSNLPVYVYIYGGAMVTGSSSYYQLQGNNFASHGVIMVSFNTRESIFASPFSAELEGTAQNFGILDVEFAMEWIHDNIAAFGGNPDHIVIGGHSSGSVHVDDYLWNHPDTWVAGAIEMSANSISGPGYAPANIALDEIAAEVGCSSGIGQLDCLRNVSMYDLETTYFNSTANTWFVPNIDNITRFSPAAYVERFAAGKYPSHVPLITGNSNGEGTVFSIVYSGENTNFTSWIGSFDADSAHVPTDVILEAYNQSDYATTSLMSGAQYGDARFDCSVDYLLDTRAYASPNAQPTWVYRFFGAYDNVVGIAGTAPTHGTEVPFFLGGNECFSQLTDVTTAQQELADSIHGWFVEWIKNPSAGPGWDRISPGSGSLVMLGVPGRETERISGQVGDFNARCQATYKPYYKDYPVVQNPVELAAAAAAAA